MASPAKTEVLSLINQLHSITRSAGEDGKAENDSFSPQETARIRDVASKLTALTTSAFDVATNITTEPVRNMCTSVAIDCGWFEILNAAKEGGDKAPIGTMTAEVLAAKSNVDKALLVRAMRVLTCEGVVDEVDVQTYCANALTSTFCTPGVRDGVKVWFDVWGPLLLSMPKYFARFGYSEPNELATCPFPFAMGQPMWKYISEDSSRQIAFNSYMGVNRAGRHRWVDVYPIKERILAGLKNGEESAVIIDVGGGWGHDILDFETFEAVKPAELKGHSILQDLDTGLPPKNGGTRQQLDKLVVKIMTYDFFTPQPFKGARAYSFRSVFHDWPDDECRKILSNTIPAMEEGYSKILVNDIVIPDKGATPWQGWIDIAIMGGAAAKERSYQDWQELFDSVGLTIGAIFSMGQESVMELDLKGAADAKWRQS